VKSCRLISTRGNFCRNAANAPGSKDTEIGPTLPIVSRPPFPPAAAP